MSHCKDPYGTNQYNAVSQGCWPLLNLSMRKSAKNTIAITIPFEVEHVILLEDACNHFKLWSRSISFCPAPRVVPRNGKKYDVLLVKASSSMWGRDMVANGALLPAHFQHFHGKRLFRLKWQKPTWRILKVYKLISQWTWCERNDPINHEICCLVSEGDEPLVQWTRLGFAESVWQNYTEYTSNMFQWI